MSTFKAKARWDIFCRIVDNYGDIGICWRLARQLVYEHQLTVRLFVACMSDESLSAAQKIIPNLNLSQSAQIIDGVEVYFWDDDLLVEEVAEVVIEAFACGLPASYSEKIQTNQACATQPSWINLEYLSAETWVNDFHATVSINPSNGLIKYFFFPGFNETTGGLLREADLTIKRDEFLLNTAEKNKFWQQLGVADINQKCVQAIIKVSLFCYSHAPVHDLLQSMATGKHVVMLFVPNNAVLTLIAAFFEVDDKAITEGSRLTKGNLQVFIIPFLSQDDYDKLLWSCDINFVRGEDSWLRAVWAAKPFIWQPYFQQGHAHLLKLNAFLDDYCHGDEPTLKANKNHAMRHLSNAWANDNKVNTFNQNEYLASTPKSAVLSDDWADFVDELASYKRHAEAYTQQLSKQPDLAAKLVIFCNK